MKSLAKEVKHTSVPYIPVFSLECIPDEVAPTNVCPPPSAWPRCQQPPVASSVRVGATCLLLKLSALTLPMSPSPRRLLSMRGGGRRKNSVEAELEALRLPRSRRLIEDELEANCLSQQR
jgi:hypothetical protein